MFITAFHGFCMSLADSVPGVSGGTIALILGYYEQFLSALNCLFGPDKSKRAPALRYLLKLGIGWCIGLTLSLFVLAELLEQNIYTLSSVFLGLTVASIPLVAYSERDALSGKSKSNWWFLLLGVLSVIGLSAFRQSPIISNAVNYLDLQLQDYIYLLITGILAIGAMVLPGISGSSLLMIFGVYVPTVHAFKLLRSGSWDVLSGLAVLVAGFVIGAALFARIIRYAMRTWRPKMIYLILGLMLGSLYAICLGPTTMETPFPALSMQSFSPFGFFAGVGILLILETIRFLTEKKNISH